MLQTEPANTKLAESALGLLRTKQTKADFANDVLDWLSEVDSGAKVYWNTFDSDKEVRKAFRAFLTALRLSQLEKKTLQNGSTIHMAFIKAVDDNRPAVLNDARSALAFALETMISDQVASLKRELMARAQIEDEGPTIATEDKVSFANDAVLPERKPCGSGLLSLEAYQTLHAAGAFESTEHSLKEEAALPDIFAKGARDNAAIAKFNKAQRLQNELWGLSATRQNKLRRHLEK